MLFLLFLVIFVQPYTAYAVGPEGYFNGTSYASLYTTINVRGRTSISFKTCSSGQLLYQEGASGDYMDLSLLPSGQLELKWQVNSNVDLVHIGSNLIDNQWHDVDLIHSLGSFSLSVGREVVLVANSSFRSEFFSARLDSSPSFLFVGRGFTGCILQGAGVVLNSSSVQSFGVSWEKCPLPDRDDCDGYQVDHCFSQPCHKYSQCVSSDDGYHCLCTARYSGRNCDIDNGPLCEKPQYNQCRNGGMCQEDQSGNITVCACLPNFTGTFCETRIDNTFCDTQPCRNGGTCNINQFRSGYVCTCPQGFAGVDCELNIDECQSSPCRNNGSCTDEVNSYTCDCSGTGYRGSNCEVNINECEESNPCYTGSTCFDRYGDYICECPPGFGGKNCDQEVNECDSGPCLNGGSCNDNLNGYLCHCIPGFAGINCEENIDDCASVSCPSNSHCVDGISTFSCVCNPGYAGAIPHCFEINECDSSPCVNGGTCHDRLNDFACTCPHGFSGRFCEFNINDCVSDPCGNGGTCVDGIGKYTCRCAPGYSGAHCEIDINDCVPNPCKNSFRCVDLVNDYLCECLPGWEGKNCVENINECSSQPCMHGECIDLLNNYTCSCDPGYTGKFCDENINECEMSPCFNGGVCTDLVADFSCHCPEDFMGKTCSEVYDACQSSPCVNGGTCMTQVPSHEYTCSCLAGFEGDQCQINIDECEGVACPAGQVCIDLSNSYQCGCPTGFTGSDCSVNVNECSSNPCVNGTCVDGIGTFACQCPEGLTGKLCETDVDECQQSPCVNGMCQQPPCVDGMCQQSPCVNGICQQSPCVHGICQNFPGSFLCFCRPGYTGILCDIEFNECLSAPCRNGATCNDLVNNYSCECVPGFSGRNCEVNIDECAENPCQNGGTCTDQINMYECQCVLGFTGKDCEINIDECASQPCYNNGICVDLVNGFVCNCTDSGFSGMFCETNIDDCASNPCQNGATCSDLIKDYHCNCYNGYDGKNCEIDIPECSPSPCQNNALCLENSNRTLYDINYLGLFPSFSYGIADGYRCICPSGFTGVNCETNIDDCEINACVNGTCIDGVNNYHCECYPGYEGDYCNYEINECEAFSPCQNGAPCTDLIADYKCDCLPEYGDKNCSTRLIGCLNQLCENGATCNPFLDENGSHHYECFCPQGFYGTYCGKSTTVSFDGMGQWVIYPQSGSIENYTLEFYFRTTLAKGIIAQGIVSQPPLEYILYLWDGSVRLNVFNASGMIVELFSKNNQNDASWKFVQVQFVPSSVTLRVSGWVDQVVAELSPVDFTFQFGSVSRDYSPSRHYFNKRVPNFIGCVQDVWVNGNIMIPDLSNEQGLTAGCPRVDQCANSPCSSGVCEDMWSAFRCICSRPYFGDRCEYSHKPGTFGYKDVKSHAKFLIPTEDRRQYLFQTDISMLLRTREETGLIFYVGTAIQDHSVYGDMSNSTFIVARLQGSKVQVIVKLQSENPVELLLDKTVNDGNYYFLKVTRNGTELVVEVSGTKMSVRVPDSILYAEEIYIGGLPYASRKKRQINAFVFDGVESYSFENITNFKGIIQDFRINGMVIEFYPLNIRDREVVSAPPMIGKADLDNVNEGVLSDDPCEPYSPCLNSASCVDIWNDYSCTCPKGFRGKKCGEPEPCSNHNCPPEAECKNLDVGYECVAPASFNGKNSSLVYETHDFGRNVTNITFFLRSKYNGTILHIRSEKNKQYFLSIELTEDSLEVRWHFGPDKSTVDEKTIGQKIDSTHGELVFVNLTFSDNLVYLKLNENTSRSEDDHSLGLGSILNSGARIFVGHNSDEEKHFKGCISEVRIAGVLLPFVNITNNPFTPKISRGFSLECLLCWEEDCKHGFCQNSTGSYNCSCQNGYEGELCDVDICESSNPCQNGGECFHLDDDIRCSCTENFTGTWCNFENSCISSLPCQYGSTCVPENDDYSCICSEHYEGKNCDIPKIKDCSSKPCQHGTCHDISNTNSNMKYKCDCYQGYEGQDCNRIIDFCKSNPCSSQGECLINETAATFYCKCKEGFEGFTCDTKIDYCASNPCTHGRCESSNTSYRCNCYPGYRGLKCESKIQGCNNGIDVVCHNGTCNPTPDGYTCSCYDGFFGKHCNVENRCDSTKCNDRGTCNPDHDPHELEFRFTCNCIDGYTGYSCAEKIIMIEDDTNLVIIILVPVMCLFILCLLIGAIVFLRIAKKKRATRGTYSPSRQEMFGSRVEMNHVMKPPPEERLI